MSWLLVSPPALSASAVFLVLMLATLLTHVHHFVNFEARHWRLIRQLDRLCLVPYWSFFAPNPGVFSYRLVVREVNEWGVSDWRDISAAPPRTILTQCVWNPHGRIRKVVLDICNDLIEGGRVLSDLPSDHYDLILRTTIPYIKCLALASTLSSFPASRIIQFAIVQIDRTADVRILLVSGRHRVA
jgi:hypothetical protein